MSYWMSAYCVRPTHAVSAETLEQHAAVLDYWTMASQHELGQDAAEAAADALRVETVSPQLMHLHVATDAVPITIDFVHDDTHQRERVALDDSLSPEVRSRLERTTCSVNFCLKQSHADGMGWPIAFQLVMHIAELAGGVVLVDDMWWDPITRFEVDDGA